MSQFQQPMLISLQSMGILAAILLALALALSLRQGRYITPIAAVAGMAARPAVLHPGHRPPGMKSATSPASCMRAWRHRRHQSRSQSLRKTTMNRSTTRITPARHPRPRRAKVAAVPDEEDDEAFAGLLDDDTAPRTAVVDESDEPHFSAILAVQLAPRSNCAVCRVPA